VCLAFQQDGVVCSASVDDDDLSSTRAEGMASWSVMPDKRQQHQQQLDQCMQQQKTSQCSSSATMAAIFNVFHVSGMEHYHFKIKLVPDAVPVLEANRS
jgi:G:T/U-mismatch repair DNA glycosylase